MSSQPKVTLVFVQSELLPYDPQTIQDHKNSIIFHFTKLEVDFETLEANLNPTNGELTYSEDHLPEGIIIPVVPLALIDSKSQVIFFLSIAKEKITLPEGCIIFHPWDLLLHSYVSTENQRNLNKLITEGKIHFFERNPEEDKTRQVTRILTSSFKNEYGLTFDEYLREIVEQQPEHEIPQIKQI